MHAHGRITQDQNRATRRRATARRVDIARPGIHLICAAKTQLDPANGPCIQRRSSAQVHKSAVQIVFVQAHLGIRIQGTSQTQNQISTAGLYQLATLGDTAGTAHDQMQALAAGSMSLLVPCTADTALIKHARIGTGFYRQIAPA